MKILTLAAVTCLLAMPILDAQAQDEVQPNLTGLWKINEAKSDDLGARMRQGKGQGSGGSEMPGGGGRRGGGGGGGGGRGGQGGQGGGPASQNPEEAQKRMEQRKLQYSSLEIFQEGAELNVTNGLDISQLIYADGRTMTIWTQHGEAEATAVWQEQTLVFQWQTRQDTSPRVRHYTISEDGQTLTVTEEGQLPEQDKPTRINLVYDRQR